MHCTAGLQMEGVLLKAACMICHNRWTWTSKLWETQLSSSSLSFFFFLRWVTLSKPLNTLGVFLISLLPPAAAFQQAVHWRKKHLPPCSASSQIQQSVRNFTHKNEIYFGRAFSLLLGSL